MSWFRFWAGMTVLAALLWAPPPAHTERTPIRIVAFGDSLTAGLGVAAHESYPAQLQRRLDEGGYRTVVVNAGVSGDTSAGGLRRVAWVLKSNPDVVILELGANDGLRGLSLTQTEENLERIIQRLLDAGTRVVLAGMKLPPNYGSSYREGFEQIFPALARRYNVTLIPFFLEGVAASATLNQADGIHPTGEGYRVIVDHVFSALERSGLLKENRDPGARPPAASPGSDRRTGTPKMD